MNRQRLLLFLLTATLAATPARAGIIFNKKKPKPDPALRVPELLGLVKTSPDESQRSDAAEELRQYDPQAFPDIIPTLLEALEKDPKPSVRIAALSTLSKFRPVSQEIGMALEQTLARDSSMRVRLQARSALLGYHWAGYRSPKKEEKPPPTTQEPPLAVPGSSPQPVPEGPALGPVPTPRGPQPLHPPTPLPPPTNSGAIRRMPIGPPQPAAPYGRPASQPASAREGPDLGSPY